MNRFLVVSVLALACAEAKQSIRVSFTLVFLINSLANIYLNLFRRKEMLYLKKSTERMLNQPREARYQSLPICAQS